MSTLTDGQKPGGQAALTAEQTGQLERWLMDDYPVMSFDQAQAQLLDEFGLKVSTGSISAFYHRRAHARMLERAADSTRAADAFRAQVGNRSLKVFETMLEIGGLSALNAELHSRRPSIDLVCQMIRLGAIGLKAQNHAASIRLRERALALQEKKFMASLPPPAEEVS